MNIAYLLLGSNLDDPTERLVQAEAGIDSSIGTITSKSSYYQTAAWGNTDQPDFINQALIVSTKLSPSALMAAILAIEEIMGRVRTEKNAPRLIDIDILFFNDLILNTPTLIIPHAQVPYRKFVLEPMNELAPSLMHPVLKKTMRQLLLDCTDTLYVKKI